jgi:hypothetical protein
MSKFRYIFCRINFHVFLYICRYINVGQYWLVYFLGDFNEAFGLFLPADLHQFTKFRWKITKNEIGHFWQAPLLGNALPMMHLGAIYRPTLPSKSDFQYFCVFQILLSKYQVVERKGSTSATVQRFQNKTGTLLLTNRFLCLKGSFSKELIKANNPNYCCVCAIKPIFCFRNCLQRYLRLCYWAGKRYDI